MDAVPTAPVLAPAIRSATVPLAAGTLRLGLTDEEVALDHLCGFACRRNPRRAFLLVSRVLGRHHAVAPGTVRGVARRLARGIPTDLPGPVLVVGLAEMAVALGQLVHVVYAERADRDDVLSLHSTRYRVGEHLCFDERHSHAARHFLHVPDDARFREARTILVVDDEVTTGDTVVALVRACLAHGLPIARVVVVTPICMADAVAMREALGLPVTLRALVTANLHFTPDPRWSPGPLAQVATGTADHAARLRRETARVGRRDPARVEIEPFADAVAPRPGERVLVVGTGEFVYEPFLLGERLAGLGAHVSLQATSRSPIQVGHAIRSAIEFPDDHGEGLTNFLYNVEPSRYDRIVVFYEHAPDAPALPELLRARGAVVETLSWNP